MKRKRGFKFLAILAMVAILLFPGCTALGGDTAPAATPPVPTTIPQLSQQVQALNSQVAALSSQVAASGATDTTALQQQINALSTTISELSVRVVALETGSTGTTITGEIDETTRWDIDAWVDYGGGYNLVELDWDTRSRIEDEDDYTVYLYLENHNINEYATGNDPPADLGASKGDLWWDGDDMWKCTIAGNWTDRAPANTSDIYNPVYIDGLTLTFRPNSGDRVVVNADDTFLDSYSRPYLDWDTEVNTRSDGTCRNIKCETRTQFTLPVPGRLVGSCPECPEPAQLKLVFELYYG